ncbi:MAG: hypothetical protein ABIK25_07330 [Pseudomonadota bacterium]
MNTKITARVDEALWESFSDQLDDLFIKKGPFLNYMIRREAPHLAADLKDKVLSTKAKRYIANELARRRPITVSIEVQKETADLINGIVDAHNIVRDAFINRLIIFLRSSEGLVKKLELPTMIDSRELGGLESFPVSPLRTLECVRDDPLFYIRTFLEQTDEGIYTVSLGPKHIWTECFIDDFEVPGTKANRQMKLISELDF